MWAKGLNEHMTKEEIQMPNKLPKQLSVSLLLGEK